MSLIELAVANPVAESTSVKIIPLPDSPISPVK